MNDAIEKWPVRGGRIFHSEDRTYISMITEGVLQFEAEHGTGEKIKARYNEFLRDGKLDAQFGVFASIYGKVIGGITYHISNDWVFLHSGFVEEAYRGIGVYSALMDTIERNARTCGLSGMFVSTYDFSAPAIYEHTGFKKGAVLTNCPDGNTSIDYYKDFSIGSCATKEDNKALTVDQVVAWGAGLIERNSDAHIVFCAECGFPIADYGADKEIHCSWCKAKNISHNHVAAGPGYCITTLDRKAKTFDKLFAHNCRPPEKGD